MCCMHCVWQTSFNFLALLGDVTFSTALLNKRCFFGEKSSYFPNIWPSILESSNVARWNYCKIQSMGARVNIDCFWSLLFNNGLASTTYIISCSQKSIVAVAELCILYKHTVFNPPPKLPYPVTWDSVNSTNSPIDGCLPWESISMLMIRSVLVAVFPAC